MLCTLSEAFQDLPLLEQTNTKLLLPQSLMALLSHWDSDTWRTGTPEELLHKEVDGPCSAFDISADIISKECDDIIR